MLITEKLQAAEDEARDNLDALVRQSGEQYAPLSRLLGQPDAYLRKWARGQTAQRLPDDHRYKLAQYFAVDARVLGAPAKEAA